MLGANKRVPGFKEVWSNVASMSLSLGGSWGWERPPGREVARRPEQICSNGENSAVLDVAAVSGRPEAWEAEQMVEGWGGQPQIQVSTAHLKM